jgi:adenylate cyclase
MDGKIRMENLYIKYGDEYFPSLGLQAARMAKDVAAEKLSVAGGHGVDLDGLWIPTDEFGRLHLKYIGKEGSIEYVSAADVLSGRLFGHFKDKIVLVGTSAIGTYDRKVTPFSADMPGVEKNATVIANIVNMDFLKRAPLYLDILAVLISGVVSMLIGCRKKMHSCLVFYTPLILLILITNQAAFNIYSLRVNLVYPLLTVLTTGSFLIAYRYFVEEKRTGEIKKIFSGSVTERVINELIKDPEIAMTGGDRREVTVLFSDIVGFTDYSEGHKPEEVVAILNEYHTAMTDIVFRWEGTLDKFIGDTVVAFWGAPLEQKDDSVHAVRCALHMIKRFEELKEKWLSEGREPLSIGIGLNTGEAIVGSIGVEKKKVGYTVIGEQVNIGSRVKSLTKKVVSDILFTESVFENIREYVEKGRIGHVSIRDVANVVVKGKTKSVMIYEIKSLEHDSESIVTETAEK